MARGECMNVIPAMHCKIRKGPGGGREEGGKAGGGPGTSP